MTWSDMRIGLLTGLVMFLVRASCLRWLTPRLSKPAASIADDAASAIAIAATFCVAVALGWYPPFAIVIGLVIAVVAFVILRLVSRGLEKKRLSGDLPLA